MRKLGHDKLILMLCVAIFLSYLPEAGEYSCFFVYLRLVMGFSKERVASFIALIGVLSVLAQTVILGLLMKYLGSKHTIIIGLVFEMVQLAIYGFGSQPWLMWMAGSIAAMGSITYPAISAFVSNHAESDQQGVAQGIVTGIRGLCNGLGPALFGFIFYIFHVDLNEHTSPDGSGPPPTTSEPKNILHILHQKIMPGPPFAFGTILVIMALLVAIFIPDEPKNRSKRTPPTELEVFHRDTEISPRSRLSSKSWSLDSESDTTEEVLDGYATSSRTATTAFVNPVAGYRIQEKEPLMTSLEEAT